MDSPATIALISIHPQYVDLISSGVKKIEFRKRFFSKTVKTLVIYSTAPISRIVGYADVGHIEYSTPNTLWKLYNSIGGIDKKNFFDYYANVSNATGIHIHRYTPLEKTLAISFLNTTPPQSYKYLTDEEFSRVCKFGGV